MKFFESLTSARTVLWGSLILSAVIIYPNIGDFLWRLFSPEGSSHHMQFTTPAIIYFFYRYLFFVGLTWLLIRVNIKKVREKLNQRVWISFFMTVAGYLLYVMIGFTLEYAVRLDCFTQTVILQFLIAWLVPVLIGHIYCLTVVYAETEKEIEKLRMENLQSRVDALTNQINPHFFFNSLNGLTALVSAKRNEETVEYVAKLSNIFRYILQSDKKGLVTLEEELLFLNAYRYLLEVRYSGKLAFELDVDESAMKYQLPVLSLLPLVENVIKHNVIDSDHRMMVKIALRVNECLEVSNPVYRKYHVEASHGIGLTNLSARYKLLMGTDIKIIEKEDTFSVVLPLKKADDESTDC